MDRRLAFSRRLITAIMLPFLLSACSLGNEGANPAVFLQGMDLALSGTPSDIGTATSTVAVSPTLTSTVVPPVDTPLPSDTPSPTITPTDTITPTPTQKPFSYVFPVQPPGVVDFTEGGHPYPATDIFAPVGTNYVAVTDGVVDFVSYRDVWDPATNDQAVAGGLCVAIIGDDGVRYYGSHLSAIARGVAPGVHVKAGQLLGLSGKTGNAANTTPHVHFGISRPTYPEDWAARRGQLDPSAYLIAWLHGENITPQFPAATLIPDPSPD